MKSVLPDMTEKELATAIEKLLKFNGWTWYHTYDSRRSNPGFPDYVAVRPGRLLFIELKSPEGRLSPDQVTWIAGLESAGQTVHVWRPSDLTEAADVLSRRRRA